MREVWGYGVANSAGPGEALANRRYGIKGGVSVGGSRTGVGSVEERRPRPFPSRVVVRDSGVPEAQFPRIISTGSSVSEKNSSRRLGEQAGRYPTPLYRTAVLRSCLLVPAWLWPTRPGNWQPDATSSGRAKEQAPGDQRKPTLGDYLSLCYLSTKCGDCGDGRNCYSAICRSARQNSSFRPLLKRTSNAA